MSNVITDLGHDIKSVFEKEKPTVEAALKAALKAVEPVWLTALGKIIMQAVLDAAKVAAAGGSLKSIEALVSDILGTAKTAGITAEQQTVTTLVGLAAQQIAAEATAAGIPTTTTTTSTAS